jgi:hypothetical protein
MYPIG